MHTIPLGPFGNLLKEADMVFVHDEHSFVRLSPNRTVLLNLSICSSFGCHTWAWAQSQSCMRKHLSMGMHGCSLTLAGTPVVARLNSLVLMIAWQSMLRHTTGTVHVGKYAWRQSELPAQDFTLIIRLTDVTLCADPTQ